MPYIMRTVKAGNTKEITKYYSARYGRKHRRLENRAETEEKQKRVNENNAEDKLRWLINSNFKKDDLFILLTYAGDAPEPEEAARALAAFLRKLRKEYRKRGKELKYIAVTEYEAKRIHHHVIANDIDYKIISSLWTAGQARFETTYSDDFYKLAHYLVKETNRTYKDKQASSKRWNASKNLKKPEIEKEIVKADSWRKVPQDKDGYKVQVDSIVNSFDYYGYPYQKYTMIKNTNEKSKNRLHRRI